MSVPAIMATQLRSRPGRPLLVLGPSLGTSAEALWSRTVDLLGEEFDVLGWDLPGHGANTVVAGPFTMAELAAGVLVTVDEHLRAQGRDGEPFHYGGDSVGGAVGLHLLLDHPDRVSGAALICTGARIEATEGWHERARLVRASGTPALVETSARRWFGPEFLERSPDVGARLLHSLRTTDREGYALVCEALDGHDVRDRLAEITTRVLTVAGSADRATPPDQLAEIADGVARGRATVLDGVGHLAPAEAPAEIALTLRALPERAPTATDTLAAVERAGSTVRREVLGDAHVDRAERATTDLTRDFQELITRYAWGTIWTRPGLDRRSRSLITLTALVARGHHGELELHLRAAVRNGLSVEEIKEVLLQTAVYCGVPDANTAFAIAQRVLQGHGSEHQ